MSWWYYVIGGIVALLGFLAYIFYKGYKKVSAKPLDGIPCPPLTHPMLGHPECMIHPFKHEMRLSMHNAARIPIHQLLLMKQVSLFVNDPIEALRVLLQFPSKGRIYGSFRYDTDVPDILACDGDAWKLRHNALSSAFQHLPEQLTPLSVNDGEKTDTTADTASVPLILQSLLTVFQQASTTQTVLNMKKTWSLYALDVLCWITCDYPLNALNGSTLGNDVYESLETLANAQQQNSLYSFPHIRQVSKEELSKAQATWKLFLQTLRSSVLSSAEKYQKEHGKLAPDRYLAHALYQLTQSAAATAAAAVSTESADSEAPEQASEAATAYGETELLSEIHQLLRHGYENIAGTLMWATYVLYRHRRVRAKLTAALAQQDEEYLECFIKELFRRYPVAGNMTVRTAHQAGHDVAGIAVPVGVPVHVHMFSLHNSSHQWTQPKEFSPERWQKSDIDNSSSSSIASARNGLATTAASTYDFSTTKARPTCPFLAKSLAGSGSEVQLSPKEESASVLPSNHPDNYQDYHGAGFEKDGVSFLPFSVGQRACPASVFVVQILRLTLRTMVQAYHLNGAEEKVMMEEDIGGSWSTCLYPWSRESLLVKVTKVPSSDHQEGANANDVAATTNGVRKRHATAASDETGTGATKPGPTHIEEDWVEDEDGWAKDE